MQLSMAQEGRDRSGVRISIVQRLVVQVVGAMNLFNQLIYILEGGFILTTGT